MKKGKFAWFGVLTIIAAIAVFDLLLDRNPNQMTISQIAFDAGQRHPYIIYIVGALFVGLFVHLFYRWKNIFKKR